MDTTPLSQSPFAALTFIAAPALLTNASSVLILSTANRMLRVRERMSDLYAKSEAGNLSESDAAHLIARVNRVEKQATLFLRALHAIYTALAAFACATIVTLLGAGVSVSEGPFWLHLMEWLGVLLGILGVSGLVIGCISLFHATQLSLIDTREEASLIRTRQSKLIEKKQ